MDNSKIYLKQKQEQQDDLNYLSGLAFEQFGFEEKEVNEITKAINKKAAKTDFGYAQSPNIGKKTMFNTIFISLLIGLFVGVSVFFVIFNKSKNHVSVYQNLIDENHTLKQSLKNTILATDTVFNIPQNQIKKQKEHFTSQDVIAIENKPLEELENLELKKATVPFSEIEFNEELISAYIPNAPVVFISNLKVANYKNYYFKQNEGVDLALNTGLSAQYESEVNLQKTQRNRNSKYFAHLIIQQAMKLFSQKQTDDCIEELQMLYDYNKQDANVQFYLGMCCLEKQQYQKALILFNDNLENEINIFHQEAEYYKAICLLKTKQTEEAKSLLLQIKNNNGFYANRAGEMLSR